MSGQGLQIAGPPGTQLVAVHVCDARVSQQLPSAHPELLSQVKYPYLHTVLEIWQSVA